MKKKIVAALLALTMVTQGAMPVFAQEESAGRVETTVDAETTKILCKEYLSEEKQIQGIEQRFSIPQEDVAFVKGLGSGTITLSFKTGSTNLQALAAINGSTHTNHYMSLYISGGNKIGFEFRKNETVNDHKNFTVNDVNLADNQWHTITLVTEKDSYYKVYLDQKLVQQWDVSETNFVDKMEWEPTSVTFGGANRISGNSYPFTGSIKEVKLYNGAVSEDQIMADHGAVSVGTPIFTYQRKMFDGTEGKMIQLPEQKEKISGLTKGTFSFAYRLNEAAVGKTIYGLLSLSNSNADREYGALYIKPKDNRIGYEVQGKGDKYITVRNGNSVNNAEWHTVTYAFDGTQAEFYLDGVSIGKFATTHLLKGNWTPDMVTLGGISRTNTTPGSKWPFHGIIDSVNVFDETLNAEQVMELHKRTLPQEEPEYGKDVYKTGEYGIYDMGDYDSYNYRIPAMVTTSKGTVIAAADQRNTHWSDWGNIDTVVRRSTDNGLTWEDPIDVIDLKSQSYFSGTQSAYTIDPAMIAEDENGKNPGRVWMLVDMFPESTNGSQGTWSIKETGTGYVKVDGKDYLALYDKDNNQYTLRENGEVFDKDNQKTDYVVKQFEGNDEQGYHEKGDLYKSGEYVGNIYLRSTSKNNDSAPLHPTQTCYLWLSYSDDDGVTWSDPVDITPQVKADWMRFCGVGPGFGVQLQYDEEHPGRLVFPIYYTIAGSGIGFQSSACIYSDDGGKTWQRGESPNDGRINKNGQVTSSQNPVGISELTESQIIELSSGNLLQFMRNTGGNGKVVVSRSTDGGATWSDPIDTTAPEVYCQLSVLYYDKNGTDGKDRVIMSNPGGSGRNNGTLRIGEVTETEDSFSVDWVEEKMFCPNNYAYSCLTKMKDGNMGLLYEHQNTIKFTAFNLDYIKDEVNLLSPTITSVTYKVEKTDDHAYTLPGDKYVITVKTDQNVTATGTPKFRFMLNGKGRYANYVSGGKDDKTLVFEYVVQKGDEGTIQFKGPKIICDEAGAVKNANGLCVSSGDMDVNMGYIGVDPSDAARDIATEQMSATAGAAQSGQGAANVLDGRADTLWHTTWGGGHGRENHWIQFELKDFYMVDGIRYQPRTSGGVNGIITEYKVEVSNDGVQFTQVATGTWAGNSAWKMASFEPVRAKYVRLTSLDALSVEADNDYASAAEIRLTGTKTEAPPVVEADKSSLEAAIAYAKDVKTKPEYQYVVPIVKQKLDEALEAAETVFANAAATQEEVDKAKDELVKMFHYLSFTGDAKSLRDLVDIAKKLNTDIYTEQSANVFKEALAEAETVLADENALQKELDAAQKKLKEAMDGLQVISVDKSKLQKLVDSSRKYVEKLDEYTTQSGEIFMGAFEAAENILGKQDATKEEVDQAYANLRNAVFGLRLLPNKDKLEELIQSAEQIDVKLYSEESAKEFMSALSKAKAVFTDSEASTQEVEDAERILAKAMDGLKEVGKAEEQKVPNKNTTAEKNDDKEKNTSPVKTGDRSTPILFALIAALSAGTVFSVRKKEEN